MILLKRFTHKRNLLHETDETIFELVIAKSYPA